MVLVEPMFLAVALDTVVELSVLDIGAAAVSALVVVVVVVSQPVTASAAPANMESRIDLIPKQISRPLSAGRGGFPAAFNAQH